jgi:hypothetical protein
MIRQHTCWSLVCDRCGEGWDDDDGTPHFDTADEAVACATVGEYALFRRRGDRILCIGCNNTAECEETGHQYGEWRDCNPGGQYAGVTYRARYCDRCGWQDSDPPFAELSDLVHAAVTINSLGEAPV